MKLPQHRLRDLFGARGPYFFFYLNSSRAAPVSGIYATLQQATWDEFKFK